MELMFGLLDVPKILGTAAIVAGLTYAVVAPAKYAAGFHAGKAAMAAAVEKQNSVAAEAAHQARSVIDACFDRGGEWLQEDQKCDR